MSTKLVISGSSKESRIALVGRSGKDLLTSATFTDPRAKGATLRALKKIFGSDVVIEDATTTSKTSAKQASAPENIPATLIGVGAQAVPKKAADARGHTRASTVKAPAGKTTKRTDKSNQPE